MNQTGLTPTVDIIPTQKDRRNFLFKWIKVEAVRHSGGQVRYFINEIQVIRIWSSKGRNSLGGIDDTDELYCPFKAPITDVFQSLPIPWNFVKHYRFASVFAGNHNGIDKSHLCQKCGVKPWFRVYHGKMVKHYPDYHIQPWITTHRPKLCQDCLDEEKEEAYLISIGA